MTVNQLVPVAQYLRMSTEHQQYSLENQSTAIQRYADSQGFEVVRTYSDAAKSGLVLRQDSAFANYCKMSSQALQATG
jgi:DNA invertase Pin-like site-specific DNA recombinase